MTDAEREGRPVEAGAAEEEIEILEIVGVDDDPGAATAGDRARGDRPSSDDAGDVVFEIDDPTAQGPPRPEAESAADERERLLRLSADFENLRNRVERERDANARQASARIVTRLLPVLDNFERALGAAAEAGDDSPLRQGVALIFRQMLEELRREGLSSVDSVGEPFDPTVHEAVATTASPDLLPNVVVEEMRRGYLLHDRLLRPALVKVNLDPSGGAARGADDEEA